MSKVGTISNKNQINSINKYYNIAKDEEVKKFAKCGSDRQQRKPRYETYHCRKAEPCAQYRCGYRILQRF